MKKTISYIYSIENKKTNRVYVGRTCNLQRRFHDHMMKLRKGEHDVEDMQKDFDLYGEESFSFSTLYSHDSQQGNDFIEYEWMEKLNSTIRGQGYNYNDIQAIRHLRNSANGKIKIKREANRANMKYKNLMAELARNGMNKEALTKKLNEAGLKISYSTVCRQLRGESEIPFGQAGLMSTILNSNVEYLLEEEVS